MASRSTRSAKSNDQTKSQATPRKHKAKADDIVSSENQDELNSKLGQLQSELAQVKEANHDQEDQVAELTTKTNKLTSELQSKIKQLEDHVKQSQAMEAKFNDAQVEANRLRIENELLKKLDLDARVAKAHKRVAKRKEISHPAEDVNTPRKAGKPPKFQKVEKTEIIGGETVHHILVGSKTKDRVVKKFTSEFLPKTYKEAMKVSSGGEAQPKPDDASSAASSDQLDSKLDPMQEICRLAALQAVQAVMKERHEKMASEKVASEQISDVPMMVEASQ